MMNFLTYITGFFYELWTFTDFDRLWNLKKGGMKLKKKSSPLKLLSQSQPNFAEMILRWSPFKIVSVSTVLYPRWPPLLKIEISSNGQNCSILSQKVPKFELYKHNDELFNIYYGFFRRTFTDFDHEIWYKKKKPAIYQMLSLGGPLFFPAPSYIQDATIIKNRNFFKWPKCSILSQKVLKFELYKHNDDLFNIYYGFFMNFELLLILTDYAN